MGLGQRQPRTRSDSKQASGNTANPRRTTLRRDGKKSRITLPVILFMAMLLLLGFELFDKPTDYYYSLGNTLEQPALESNVQNNNTANKIVTAIEKSSKDAEGQTKPTQNKLKNDKKQTSNDKEWKWFDGDLNAYYNSLETQIHDRDPSKISSYAVHRWMTPKRSTEEHYKLIDRAVSKHHSQKKSLKVFDGGCGLGSALMFFHQRHPEWDLTGHTISEHQYSFIETKLPAHSFKANLRSFDDIEDGLAYDVIYSIEALIHSTDIVKTMTEWVAHLEPGGIIVIIDDYVSEGVDKQGEDIQSFSKSWLANVLITPSEFESLGKTLGLEMVENRDLLAEYEIVKINYRNQKPVIKPVADRNHQGWMGSKWRQRLTVEGKLAYNMIVLKKSE